MARMGEKRGCIGSWWGNRTEGDHWGDLDVDVWIILERISRRWDVGMWTGLGWSKYRDRWRKLVSAVVNLRVPLNAGNFLTSCKPLASQEPWKSVGNAVPMAKILYLPVRLRDVNVPIS